MNYTIGQTARKVGMTAHTLRYYDKEGLLPFVERTKSGIRTFSDSDLEWLGMINCLKNTGMPIKEIRVFIDYCMAGDTTLEKRLELLKQQRDSVLRQIGELQQYLQKIDYKVWYYETAVAVGTEAVHRKEESITESSNR